VPIPTFDQFEVERLAFSYKAVRLGRAHTHDNTLSCTDSADSRPMQAMVSPEEGLNQALSEIKGSVAAQLLQALANVSPTYFETIVLDLLHKMGYGTDVTDVQRVGGVGDAGIDGIISLDRLGLEKVYVQAKRWQQPIGRPEVQGFYGALKGQKANKGVFITTSSFTNQAKEYVDSVENIILIDGARLADLMIEYEVGVSSRTVRIPKIDGDYFDEEST